MRRKNCLSKIFGEHAVLNRIEIFFIRYLYQTVFSPFLGNQCKFIPSCSNYGIDALHKYSFFKANCMIIWRIIRCNPFSRGGFDPA